MPFSLKYMKIAFEEAEKAALRGEVPVGAVVVQEGTILSQAGNEIIQNSDPTAHAEILAIRRAAHRMGLPRLPEAQLYVTLEPCPMCAQAIAFARIKTLYFGAYDPKGGGVLHGAQIFKQSSCHHKMTTIEGGIEEDRSAKMLKDFFKARR